MSNTAEQSLAITSLFEAEIFVQLMLWRWKHPLADDIEFANGLLERASEALRCAKAGVQLIVGLPPADLNFIAALWYAEHSALGDVESEQENTAITLAARRAWLKDVRHTFPSCFCDPSDLHPT